MNKYVMELIGTFFLVLTVGLTVVGGGSGVIPPLAIGTVLMVMVFAGGHISGAHYNPAISLGVWLRGKMAGKDLLAYWAFQLVGALLAALAVQYLRAGVPITTMNLLRGPALLAEFLFTFALVLVVISTATAKGTEGNSFYGLAIGFTVMAGAFAVGNISGGAFNPAVALGTSLLKLSAWSQLWIYWLAEFLGGACAAYAFLWMSPADRVTPAVSEKAHAAAPGRE